MRLLDLEEVEEMPFRIWSDWYFAEQEVPFLDRRLEDTAFLICRVLASVWHDHLTPTEKMFRLSPEIVESAPDADFPAVDQDSIDRFTARVERESEGE